MPLIAWGHTLDQRWDGTQGTGSHRSGSHPGTHPGAGAAFVPSGLCRVPSLALGWPSSHPHPRG